MILQNIIIIKFRSVDINFNKVAGFDLAIILKSIFIDAYIQLGMSP
jgi:hypothetical protein